MTEIQARERIAELEVENAALVRAINELREQMTSIGAVASEFRRMPIRDLSEAYLKRVT